MLVFRNLLKCTFLCIKTDNEHVFQFLINAFMSEIFLNFSYNFRTTYAFVLRESNIGGLPLLCMYVCIYVCIVYVHMYVCMYVCVCIFVYVYTWCVCVCVYKLEISGFNKYKHCRHVVIKYIRRSRSYFCFISYCKFVSLQFGIYCKDQSLKRRQTTCVVSIEPMHMLKILYKKVMNLSTYFMVVLLFILYLF
jgi:hypothetical protein